MTAAVGSDVGRVKLQRKTKFQKSFVINKASKFEQNELFEAESVSALDHQ